MKAIIIKQFGAADQMQLAEVPKPEIENNEVLIEVKAAGINPVDTKIRSGNHVSCKDLELPAILGKEMSGIVQKIGDDVKYLMPGDEVFGFVNNSYAEWTKASEELIVKKPTNIAFEEAGAVSLVGLTAYQAINEHLKIQPGQRVLIQSAAGGVGHLAVQFAKLNGAYIYGTASGENSEFLKEIGVDHPINYKLEKFEEIAKDLDAVMDTMGGEILYRAIQSVKPGGKVVCLPSSTKDDPKAVAIAAEKGVELIWFMVRPDQEILKNLALLLETGKLKVHVQQTFEMKEISAAHQLIEYQGVRGKLAMKLV